jgi:serine/threonine protein kinase
MIFNNQDFESYLADILKIEITEDQIIQYDTILGSNIHQFIDCIKTNCPDCPQEIIDLLHKMVSRDPNERPELLDVITTFNTHASQLSSQHALQI